MVALERRLSVERLSPYRVTSSGDLGAALALYAWNAELSAALGTTIGHLEVVLRNAMHDELTAWSTRTHGEPRWYLDPGGVLTSDAVNDIAKARLNATKNGRSETPGRVVAELSLGFWRYLLAGRYERTLWLCCLRDAFPGLRGRGMRRDVHDAVRDLNPKWNRMAHHEPVFKRPVEPLRDAALQVAGWMCPISRAWIDQRCRVPQVIGARPCVRCHRSRSCVPVPAGSAAAAHRSSAW